MTGPLFSIITCTYNSSKYLTQNIESVNNQLFDDYEQIFVDGFSSDNTMNILHDYQANHPNVIIIQAPAKGIANAMNLGIRDTRGRYLLFLNSDDYFYDNLVLEKAANYIKKNSYSWYYGSINTISEEGKQLFVHPRHYYQRLFRYWIFSLSFIMQHQAIFYGRELFEKHGNYNETMDAMDYEYAMRIRLKEKAGFINTIVTNFRLGGFSSTHKEVMESNIKKILKKHFVLASLWFYLRTLYIKLFIKNYSS